MKRFGLAFALGALAAIMAFATPIRAEPQLVMVEQPGCVYCDRWDEEIAHIYPKTAAGQFAPLLRADLRSGPPDGMTYARKVSFTPTFILMDNGQEVFRIEGYPGEDFFWSLLEKMLTDQAGFDGAPS